MNVLIIPALMSMSSIKSCISFNINVFNRVDIEWKHKTMFSSVYLGMMLIGSISTTSDFDYSVLDKLRNLENRLLQQETKLAEQQIKLAEQETKLAAQDTMLAEQKGVVFELESRLSEQDIRMAEQELVYAKQQRQIDQQQRIIKQQKYTINSLKMNIIKQTDAVDHLAKQMADKDLKRYEDGNKNVVTNYTEHHQHIRNVIPSMIVRQQPERVAFTAYLDHDLVHLGIDHPIPYNKVLLNEGSAYHTTTGIFICPVDGLYGFYFSISTYGIHQDVAKLVVEGVNQVDAIVDTFHNSHNAQSANFAVVSLRQGQQVWVASYHDADQSISSQNGYRFATFSGFLLL